MSIHFFPMACGSTLQSVVRYNYWEGSCERAVKNSWLQEPFLWNAARLHLWAAIQVTEKCRESCQNLLCNQTIQEVILSVQSWYITMTISYDHAYGKYLQMSPLTKKSLRVKVAFSVNGPYSSAIFRCFYFVIKILIFLIALVLQQSRLRFLLGTLWSTYEITMYIFLIHLLRSMIECLLITRKEKV